MSLWGGKLRRVSSGKFVDASIASAFFETRAKVFVCRFAEDDVRGFRARTSSPAAHKHIYDAGSHMFP